MSSVPSEKVNYLRGKWIVVEGPDRIGKTTLINNFVSYLESNGIVREDIVTIAFPRRQSQIGVLLANHLSRKIMLNEKSQVILFIADMLESYNQIRSSLCANKVIICDRYTASTFSYALAQNSLSSQENRLTESWLEKAISLVKQPDLYVFILPDEANSIKIFERPGFGKERTETPDIQRKVIEYMKYYGSTYVKNVTSQIEIIVKESDTQLDILKTLVKKLEINEFD